MSEDTRDVSLLEGLIIMEWGYKAHERGLNIEAAKLEFARFFEPKVIEINASVAKRIGKKR